MIKETEIFAKIHKKLADYGFILRYPEGKEASTGYTYEPWHFRYVKDKEIAKEIMSNNMTFEEYLEGIKDVKSSTSAEKYQIEQLLQKEFKDNIYKDKISDSRFNITKIYSDKEMKNNEALKSLKLVDEDIAFEVTYEVLPTKDKYITELETPNGKYDEKNRMGKRFI